MVFQYRKRYGLHAMKELQAVQTELRSFNTASGMDCMQLDIFCSLWMREKVSIPQAVWIACNRFDEESLRTYGAFQYRKRYGLHAIRFSEYGLPSRHRFNTASGMDCMQYKIYKPVNLTPHEFQYRKRYGLHAILKEWDACLFGHVSIPQAVWIACNTVPHSPWDS